MMYYYNFDNNSLDFLLNYNLSRKELTGDNVRSFDGDIKFDTGSDISIFPARQIGLMNITEEQFATWLQTNENVSSIKAGHIKKKSLFVFSVEGIDKKSVGIKSYAYQVDRLSLTLDNGKLNLGSVPITVTFDERFTQPLFGRDLISLLNTTIDTDKMFLGLELAKWMQAENHRLIDGVYMMNNHYYEANYLLNSLAAEDEWRD